MTVFTWANGTSLATVRSLIIGKLSPIIDVVTDFGATGNGSTDDTTAIQNALNAAYGTSGAPHEGSITTGGAGVFLNRPVFFPPGKYKITSPLTLTRTRGAHVFGAGRFVTTIQNTSGGSVFVTNGCEYSKFEQMQLLTSSTGVCFDLDWDGTGSSCALQSNTFRELYFDGGAYGLRIGHGGFMGSENTIQNCYFANHTTAGVATRNANALQNSVYGGNISGCAIGIWVFSGSVPIISGVGFQNQTDADIAVDNTAKDTYVISACRSESNYAGSAPGPTKMRFANGPGVVVNGYTCTATVANTFAFCEGGDIGTYEFNHCWSTNGVINSFSNGKIWIRGGSFGNSSFVSTMGSGGRIMQWERGPLTVATLPTAGAHLQGLRQFVTDANSSTFGATAASGGSNKMGVICDGSLWKIGG